jgi:DTW domain-containing protein YfiP
VIDPAKRCVRCHLPRCVCDQIPRVETRLRITIVRHAAERTKMSNTAHFAKLAMPGCTIVEYGLRDQPFSDEALPSGAGTYVLFPEEAASDPPVEPPERLIVLDGTWRQARRMRQRIGGLRGLPFLALPAPSAPRVRLRRPPHPAGMSTLEAIAAVVARYEGEERAAPLDALHDRVVDACLTVAEKADLAD